MKQGGESDSLLFGSEAKDNGICSAHALPNTDHTNYVIIVSELFLFHVSLSKALNAKVNDRKIVAIQYMALTTELRFSSYQIFLLRTHLFFPLHAFFSEER